MSRHLDGHNFFSKLAAQEAQTQRNPTGVDIVDSRSPWVALLFLKFYMLSGFSWVRAVTIDVPL
jgi:hypothetical protein